MPHANYLSAGFTRRKLIVEECYNLLKTPRYEFDAIVVRGVSGLLIGAIVAHILDKPILVVRKPWEIKDGRCHSCYLVESAYDKGAEFKWIFFDDCIGQGATQRSVREAMTEHHPGSTYIHTFLWGHNGIMWGTK